MEREFNLKPTDSLKSLHNAVVDGLIVETITIGCKGSKAGVEQEGYWIPDREQVKLTSLILHYVAQCVYHVFVITAFYLF